MDKQGTYKTPCPDCGGEVKYWFVSADCRGNDAVRGIQCQGCTRAFTHEEWEDAEKKHGEKPEKTENKKLKIVLCSEMLLLGKQASIEIYVGKRLFARVTAKVEQQKGADGKSYPGVTLAMTSEDWGSP